MVSRTIYYVERPSGRVAHIRTPRASARRSLGGKVHVPTLCGRGGEFDSWRATSDGTPEVRSLPLCAFCRREAAALVESLAAALEANDG